MKNSVLPKIFLVLLTMSMCSCNKVDPNDNSIKQINYYLSKDYEVGDYFHKTDITIEVRHRNGKITYPDTSRATYSTFIVMPTPISGSTSIPWFNRAMKYYLTLGKCIFKLHDGTVIEDDKSKEIQFYVSSIIGKEYELKSFNYNYDQGFEIYSGNKFSNLLGFDLEYHFFKNDQDTIEYVNVDEKTWNSNDNYTMELYQNGVLVNDPLNHVLTKTSSYRISVTDLTYNLTISTPISVINL